MSALIVDAKNLCYRTGVIGNLSNAQGLPVEVIYGFLKVLSSQLRDFDATSCFVIWDGRHSAWRKGLFSDYKNRHRKDHEFSEEFLTRMGYQISILERIVLPQLPVLQLHFTRAEADDVVAALSSIVEDPVIVSTDHDYYQLLDEARISDGSGLVMTRDHFVEKFGFEPRSWVCYRALVGDNSDNIPGVRGIGKVTAEKILSDYGSVERWAESETGRRVTLFLDQRDVYERNLMLIDLRRYPLYDDIRAVLDRKIKEFRPALDEERFQLFLFKNAFKSILARYTYWVEPFRQLEKGEDR